MSTPHLGRKRKGLVAAAAFLALASACDDPPARVSHKVDAQVEASAPPPPAREGCSRTGSIENIENDAACTVSRADENQMRIALEHSQITLDVEPPEVPTGSRAMLRLAITNRGNTESTFFFEARMVPAGPRHDWSRLSGIPTAQPGAAKGPRLFFLVTTTDGRGSNVDALPMLPENHATASPPTLLSVHVKPGGTIVRSLSWLAYAIPAPAPMYKDDAGHRYYPKTAPTNLSPGEYTLTVEVPFYGVARERAMITKTIKVTRPPPDDAGP